MKENSIMKNQVSDAVTAMILSTIIFPLKSVIPTNATGILPE